MFNRSQGKQGKQQGFAKEQRIADAQLASLKQLGLIGRDKKGFASAWGGTEPITTASGSGSAARTGPNYTTIKPPGDPDNGPSFPEKGELSSSLSLFPKTFPSHTRRLAALHTPVCIPPLAPRLPLCCSVQSARCVRARAVVLPPAHRPPAQRRDPVSSPRLIPLFHDHRPFHRRWDSTTALAPLLPLDWLNRIP